MGNGISPAAYSNTVIHKTNCWSSHASKTIQRFAQPTAVKLQPLGRVTLPFLGHYLCGTFYVLALVDNRVVLEGLRYIA